MKRRAAQELAALTRALFQAETGRLEALLQEETRLRRDLAMLKVQQDQAMTLPQADGLRRIGADVLWQGWLDRNRAEVQMHLAQILARKARILPELRESFGRQQASAVLLHRQEMTAAQNRAGRERQAQEALTCLKACSGYGVKYPAGRYR